MLEPQSQTKVAISKAIQCFSVFFYQALHQQQVYLLQIYHTSLLHADKQ